jgi:DNA segregation ATPase FtsK/SpoIIIE, S-DNA-T family
MRLPCRTGVHTKVPPAPFCPEFAFPPGIIKAALGLCVRSRGSPSAAWERECEPSMKSIRIVLSPTRSRPWNIFLGLVLSLVSLLLFLALATYHASDPSLNTAASLPVRNWAGLFGAWIGDLLLQTLGVTAFFLPLWLAGIGWTWMHSRPSGSALLRWTGTLLALAFLPAVFGLLPWHWRWLHVLPAEGVVGQLVSGLLVTYLNIQGAWLVSGVLAAAGLCFASAVSFWAFKENIADRWLLFRSWQDRWRNWREERAERKAERLAEDEARRAEEASSDADEQPRRGFFAGLFRRKREPSPDPLDVIPAYQRARLEPQEEQIPVTAQPAKTSIWERAAERPGAPIDRPSSMGRQPAAGPAAATGPALTPAPSLQLRAMQTQSAELRPVPFPSASFPFESTPAPASRADGPIAIHDRADSGLRTTTVAPKHVSGFKLPPSTLLNAGDGPQAVREDALREEAKILVEKCGEFDVRGQVVQINPGPMVTTFEFKPEAGVKYSRVTGLADDLCLAMRAESILIERMAGKSTVGIQVPNYERETIHLRDVLESETFHKAKSRLTLAMGKDINGRIVTADLSAMPHVLIAGSTGSGKSVAINAMIMSLLFRTTPAQVRLILVDPKRVELGMYEGVPHLFTPIITEPKLAANALRNAVREMERRLKLLASRSVRNIDQYNKLFEGAMASLFDEAPDEEPLPFIVIIIDELADLMILDRANVEESITRLAQMARAVGIHLILATQRPSVDVITGLIKANIPTRISFRLSTKVDSRTILDTNGAEALLGRGDMLFLPPGTSRLMRLHAPYVSEKETAAVVGFWKAQGQAEYVEGFLESPKDDREPVEGSNDDPDENDPLFNDAVQLVFEFGKASTSLLQRRLRIGYGRAAHLIDLMERDGLVGPADGSRPRELLKAPGWLHEVAATAND